MKNTMQSVQNKNWDIIVIGGGPAGLMAATTAGKYGARVLLIEKNEIMGKKLLISGGGRCNMTNAEPDERKLLANYGEKSKFLFSPFSQFGVAETIQFFERCGVKTKIEDRFRVFPVSDKSSDVLAALVKSAEENNVVFRVGTGVTAIQKGEGNIISIILENGEEIRGASYIVATGGRSHPETGSTGDGFKWLSSLGHTIVAANPSLVPIVTKEKWVSDLSGITLSDASATLYYGEEKIKDKKASGKGRILFTHDGLSGPTILNMSKMISDLLEGQEYGPHEEVKVVLDFFPGLGLDILKERMIKLFDENPKKKVKNLVIPEVPEKVYLKILSLLSIDGEWFAGEIRREERYAIFGMCKKFTLTVEKLHGYDKAIISSGGVDLAEVDFKTLGSKLYTNLFLIGDILDFDRPSGGFSLQLCWTTGYVAGKSAAHFSREGV